MYGGLDNISFLSIDTEAGLIQVPVSMIRAGLAKIFDWDSCTPTSR